MVYFLYIKIIFFLNLEKFVQCKTCLRSIHVKCYKEFSLTLVEKEDISCGVIAHCNWCKSFDFVRYGQYCMGRLGCTYIFKYF